MGMRGFPGHSGNTLPMQTMQETQVWSLDREDPPEEDMATHSSILAPGIPQSEEPSGLQSLGCQRVGHDWLSTHTHRSRWEAEAQNHFGGRRGVDSDVVQSPQCGHTSSQELTVIYRCSTCSTSVGSFQQGAVSSAPFFFYLFIFKIFIWPCLCVHT